MMVITTIVTTVIFTMLASPAANASVVSGAGPVTLLNCDNLRHNGDRSRSGLLQFVEQIGRAHV